MLRNQFKIIFIAFFPRESKKQADHRSYCCLTGRDINLGLYEKIICLLHFFGCDTDTNTVWGL